MRSETGEARHRDGEARAALDQIVRAAEGRKRRLAAIAGEAESWRKRHDDAASQQAKLAERYNAVTAEIETLAARPPAIAAERERLAASVSIAAAERQRIEDGTNRGRDDTAPDGRSGAARGGGGCRIARTAGLVAGAPAGRRGCARPPARRDWRASRHRSGRTRRACSGRRSGSNPGASGPGDAIDLAARLDRLLRERAAIGAVNLLAAAQMDEIEGRLADIERERADLTEAIAQLRRGVAALDQEGRKRLIAAFDALNGHFGTLFARLFGGGRATRLGRRRRSARCRARHPRQPARQALASLSLLSGGEQALTALALIFAMFLTQPAPSAYSTRSMRRSTMPMSAGSAGCFRHRRDDRHKVSRHHASSRDDGAYGPAVRRHDGRARRVAARLSRSGARRGAAAICLIPLSYCICWRARAEW